jgi:hypothetical protein
MRRRLLPLLLFGLLGLAGVSGAAVSSGPAAPPPAWGPAILVPGAASLAAKDDADVNSVSCAAAGNCAAGGSAGSHAFVADETNGSWGQAIEVPGTASLNTGGDAAVESVSCADQGSCTAGGYYADHSTKSSFHYQAFVADETNGSWGRAIEVPGTATLNSGDDAGVFSISCATAGNCVAGGSYSDGSGKNQAFVVEEQNGSWGDAIEVPGTASLNKRSAEVDSVSCGTAGNCAAGGFYSVGSYRHAFLVDETNGSWGDAIKVPATAPRNSSDYERVDSVSCATAGNCVAGGDDGGGPFVIDETNGSWGKAIDVPGTRERFGSGDVYSVSCATAGNCAAGGSTDRGAFVADERNGRWGTATFVSGYLNHLNLAEVNSVSCPAAGNCVAGGDRDGGKYGNQAFVIHETHGRWRSPILVSGPGIGREFHPTSEVSSVSCGTAGSCAAGGYHDHSDDQGDFYDQAFVLSSTPALSLHAGGTRCNGGYAGTGDHVVVRAGDTCTLVPGTHVTGDVTVSHGGTLYATGVKIGGVLTIAGSATLCQSTVRGNVKAVSPGGSLEFGGRSCVHDNRFSSDVLVKNDAHDVSIRRNTVTGNLVVLNSHGKTDWILGNTVSNLLVAHSGPVVVRNNHAKGTLRCTADRRLHGRGNRARGENTCPE